MFEFHVSRRARDAYRFDESLFVFDGRVIFADFRAARLFAQRINTGRPPDKAVRAGDIYALGLVEEYRHAIVQAYRKQVNSYVLRDALQDLSGRRIDPETVRGTLGRFLHDFPPVAVYSNLVSIKEYLDSTTTSAPPGSGPRGNADAPADQHQSGRRPAQGIVRRRAAGPGNGLPENHLGIARVLRLPARVRARSSKSDRPADRARPGFAALPQGPARVHLRPLGRDPGQKPSPHPRRVGPPPGGGKIRRRRSRAGPGPGFRGRRAGGLARPVRPAPGVRGTPSARPGTRELQPRPPLDAASRPHRQKHLCLARSTLPKIRPPRQPPRPNSRRGTRRPPRRGHHRVVADRRLGTKPGFAADQADHRQSRSGRLGLFAVRLHRRRGPGRRAGASTISRSGPPAAAFGWPRTWSRTTWASIRAGSSSIPTGSSACRNPRFPAYSFNGADLSWDERVGIRIEDRYYDRTDAAVVFQRLDKWTGDVRYIYHGNDGTSIPWNDTAQLDFLNPRGSGSRHPDDPPCRPQLSHHPLRRGHDPGQTAPSAAVVPGAGDGRSHPFPGRTRPDPRSVRRGDSRGILARGGRPGGRRGARYAAPGRGVLAHGRILRPDARACTGSTTAPS